MITIKLSPWVTIGGITHTATSYQVASDILFTNLLDDVVDDVNNLVIYHSPVVVPQGVTYYARSRRLLSDGSYTNWSDAMPVTAITGQSGVTASNPVVVYQPTVYANGADITAITNGNTLNITSSAFAGENDGHGYTIWIVADQNGDIINYLKSSVDLTSVTFPVDQIRWETVKEAHITVIHGTNTGIESKPGNLVLELSLANFTLTTTRGVFSPGVDVNVTINPIPTLPYNEPVMMSLYDINGTELWSVPINPGTTNVTVPGSFLLANTQYILRGYAVAGDVKYAYAIPLDIVGETAPSVIRSEHVYVRKLTKQSAALRYPHDTTFCTEEVYGGKMYTPLLGGLTAVTLAQDGNSYITGNRILGTYINPTINTKVLAIPIPGDRMLVEYTSTGGTTVSRIYNIDYYTNTATVQSLFWRTGSRIADNNAIVLATDGSYYLGRRGKATIDKYDITTNVTASNVALPSGVNNIELLCRDMGSSILTFHKGVPDIYSYNVTNDTYTPKYTMPLTFRDRSLMQVRLVNGDVLIWKPIVTETVNGASVTDTIFEFIYIDNIHGSLDHVVTAVPRSTNVTSVVSRNDGTVLLIDDSVSGANVYTFE